MCTYASLCSNNQDLYNNHKQPLNLMLQAFLLFLCLCISVLYVRYIFAVSPSKPGNCISSYLKKSTYHVSEPRANK